MHDDGRRASEGVNFRQVDAAPDIRTAVEFLDASAALLADLKQASYAALALASGMRVLDVGCGTGDDARAMADIVGQSGRVIGLDSSEQLLDVARTRTEDRDLPVEFVLGDVRSLPFADGTSRAGSQVVDRVVQRAAEAGAITQAEHERWDEYYATAVHHGRYFQSLSAFAVWGRKPPA